MVEYQHITKILTMKEIRNVEIVSLNQKSYVYVLCSKIDNKRICFKITISGFKYFPELLHFHYLRRKKKSCPKVLLPLGYRNGLICSESRHNATIAIIMEGTKSKVKLHQLHSRPTIYKATSRIGRFKGMIDYFFCAGYANT